MNYYMTSRLTKPNLLELDTAGGRYRVIFREEPVCPKRIYPANQIDTVG